MIELLKLLWASPHRRQLLLAGGTVCGALLLGLAMIGLSAAHLATRAAAHDVAQADWAAANGTGLQLRFLRAELTKREDRVRAMKAHGFLAAADRVGWAEQVSAALAAHQPLGYGVEVSVVVHPGLPQDLQDLYNNRGISPPRIEAVDLRFTVQGLHEVELAEAVEHAVAAGGGVVRVERCKMARRSDGIGLDAECDLRRYAMPAGTAGNEPVEPEANPEGGAVDTLTAGVAP